MAVLLLNFGDNPTDTAARQADHARCTGRKIQNPATDEGAPIIDGHDHAAAAMRDFDAGAEWQGTVSGSQGVLVEALAGRGALA
jgi:hypothetical protein